MAKGQAKGSENERSIGRLFDDWWEVPRGTFRRTLHQGSWWKHADLYSTNLRLTGHFPFIPEAKFYKSYDLLKRTIDEVTKFENNLLYVWWEQCTDQHGRAFRDMQNIERAEDIIDLPIYPLLIFTMNFHPQYVALYRKDFMDTLLYSKYCREKSLDQYLIVKLSGYDEIIITTFKKFSTMIRKPF